MKEHELFSCADLGNGIFAITAWMKEQIYLVLGSESALLIDTGMGIGSLRKYIESLTTLPLIVMNTHGHPDHAGGNGEFEEVYQHSADVDIYQKMCTKEYRLSDMEAVCGKAFADKESQLIPQGGLLLPLKDRRKFDLGNRTIEIIHMPGHTPGSICLYDSSTETLFSGDTIVGVDCWLYLDHCAPLETYYKALEKLKAQNWTIQSICPGHLPTPLKPEMIDLFIGGAGRILSHSVQGTPCRTFAGAGMRYPFEGGCIIYNPDNLYENQSDPRNRSRALGSQTHEL